jgi:hypothetical protein
MYGNLVAFRRKLAVSESHKLQKAVRNFQSTQLKTLKQPETIPLYKSLNLFFHILWCAGIIGGCPLNGLVVCPIPFEPIATALLTASCPNRFLTLSIA